MSRLLRLLVVVGCLIPAVACSTRNFSVSPPLKAPFAAVAIRTTGGRAPTSDQVNRILQALTPELTRSGFVLASDRSVADVVVLVSFTPAPEGSGGRLVVTGMEPSARFKESTAGGDSEEAKEIRRRQREYERWTERQMQGSDL